MECVYFHAYIVYQCNVNYIWLVPVTKLYVIIEKHRIWFMIKTNLFHFLSQITEASGLVTGGCSGAS